MEVADWSTVAGAMAAAAVGAVAVAGVMGGGTQKSEGVPGTAHTGGGDVIPAEQAHSFKPEKKLSVKDMILVDMLNGNDHKGLCFVLTDPDIQDNPIIFSSDGFCAFTQYAKSEVEGRNCRFLQGEETKKEDVDNIRQAVKERRECSVNLLNYRKDGTTFRNQFFMCPMFGADGSLAYYLGVQVQVDSDSDGQQDENPAWVYQMGLHV